MRVLWCVEVPGSVSRPQHAVFPMVVFSVSWCCVTFSLILSAAPFSSVTMFVLIPSAMSCPMMPHLVPHTYVLPFQLPCVCLILWCRVLFLDALSCFMIHDALFCSMTQWSTCSFTLFLFHASVYCLVKPIRVVRYPGFLGCYAFSHDSASSCLYAIGTVPYVYYLSLIQ